MGRSETEKSSSKLVIAISSTALFDMSESHSIYEQEGVEAYSRYQRQHEDDILEPGEALPLVSKLLSINDQLEGDPRVGSYCYLVILLILDYESLIQLPIII